MLFRNTRRGLTGWRRWPALAFALCLLYAGVAAAQDEAEEDAPAVPQTLGGCAPPEAIALPENATPEELRALVKVVKGYVGDGNAYIVCLTKYEETLGKDDEERARLIESHNAMVDTMHATAATFNEARKTALDAAGP